jgi:ribosomal protein S18 acetylase RimI-like enzyme
MPLHREQIRLLAVDDIPLVERLLRTSEYIYQRFTLEELPLLLERYPAVGLFHGATLQGFLLSQVVDSSIAWIGGFGVSWGESRAYLSILQALLEHLCDALRECGVSDLHYSGNDAAYDWLRSILLTRGFAPYRSLFSYDKFDYRVPTSGNQAVTIRPVNLVETVQGQGDMAALLAIDEQCFEALWRYDRLAFIDIANTHPYFVVAELRGEVIGYQFNALDGNFGYLVRIAVQPTCNSQGIGARLMAEAIQFFAQNQVARIMLNTQEDNVHAHRLYEWFGFTRLQQMGFVLRRGLS